MKFIVNSEELGKNLQGLAKMIADKSSLAILDHFLFEVDGNNIQLTASDGENMMQTTLQVELQSMMDDENNKFCIHNTVICEFLKNIPTQPITFIVDMTKEIAEIQYLNGHIHIPCVAGMEYPSVKLINGKYNTVSLPADILLDDINRTCPFVGRETLRPVMNSICFNFQKENLDVVSTNGSVLIKISHPIHTEDEGIILLPPKPANILKYFLNKVHDDLTIHFMNNTSCFECNNWKLTCRLVDGNYPNYNRVIPQSNHFEMKIDKKDLQNGIRRILPMGNQDNKAMKLDIINDIMTISSENIDYSTSAKEHIPCEFSGNTLTIHVNGETLNTILSQIHNDTIKLMMTECSRPIIILPDVDKDNEIFLSMLMPLAPNFY